MAHTLQKLGGALAGAALGVVGCGGSDSSSARPNQWSWTEGKTNPGFGTGGATAIAGVAYSTGGVPQSGTTPIAGIGTGGHRATGGYSATSGPVARCHTLVNAAPPAAILAIPEIMPQAKGGLIASGTYYAISYVQYTGLGGSTMPTFSGSLQYTMAFSGCTTSGCSFEGVTDLNVADVSIHVEASGTLTTGEYTYFSQVTCATEANTGGGTGEYTATGDQFITLDRASSTAVVYARQPLLW